MRENKKIRKKASVEKTNKKKEKKKALLVMTAYLGKN